MNKVPGTWYHIQPGEVLYIGDGSNNTIDLFSDVPLGQVSVAVNGSPLDGVNADTSRLNRDEFRLFPSEEWQGQWLLEFGYAPAWNTEVKITYQVQQNEAQE